MLWMRWLAIEATFLKRSLQQNRRISSVVCDSQTGFGFRCIVTPPSDSHPSRSETQSQATAELMKVLKEQADDADLDDDLDDFALKRTPKSKRGMFQCYFTTYS
jgi:hypothetical protein